MENIPNEEQVVYYYGIDLGTTFSVIARYDSVMGIAQFIPDEDTPIATVPSAVLYPENGEPIVGSMALNQGKAERLVRTIKNQMGKDFTVEIGDTEYTPEQVSAEILKKLRQNVKVAYEEEVNSVVITVPAYFGYEERHATLRAAELAGWKVDWDNPENSEVCLLDEPSAAALSYVIDKAVDVSDKFILASDLGGGTYDVTLLQTETVKDENGSAALNIRSICVEGDHTLGGEKWDDKLEEYIISQCQEQGHNSPDPESYPRLARELRERVVNAKEVLTKMEKVDVVCCSGNIQEVTREKFEELTAAELGTAEQWLRVVLEKMSKPWELPEKFADLRERQEPIVPDIILLVGGSSKMPMVKRMVEEVTGQEPLVHRDLNLLVSYGAAIDACLKSGKWITVSAESSDDPSNRVIIKEPPKSVGKGVGIGVGLIGQETNAIVIEPGNPVDTLFTRSDLCTSVDDQRAIRFDIYEGSTTDLDDCRQIGSATLVGLPPGLSAGTPVEAKLQYDSNGIIVGEGACILPGGERMTVDIEVKPTKESGENVAETN